MGLCQHEALRGWADRNPHGATRRGTPIEMLPLTPQPRPTRPSVPCPLTHAGHLAAQHSRRLGTPSLSPPRQRSGSSAGAEPAFEGVSFSPSCRERATRPRPVAVRGAVRREAEPTT